MPFCIKFQKSVLISLIDCTAHVKSLANTYIKSIKAKFDFLWGVGGRQKGTKSFLEPPCKFLVCRFGVLFGGSGGGDAGFWLRCRVYVARFDLKVEVLQFLKRST